MTRLDMQFLGRKKDDGSAEGKRGSKLKRAGLERADDRVFLAQSYFPNKGTGHETSPADTMLFSILAMSDEENN